MSKKQTRTQLDSLPAGARVLDQDDLSAVSGGLRRFGGGGGGVGPAQEGTWTWTAPVNEGDLYTKDDE
jgi:hypothetical protein